MGARSDLHVVDQPFPVVFDAFVRALPTRGYRIVAADPGRGRISLTARNTRLELAVGAVGAITTEWVATAELRIGVFRDRHDEHFAALADALDQYLRAYYPSS